MKQLCGRLLLEFVCRFIFIGFNSSIFFKVQICESTYHNNTAAKMATVWSIVVGRSSVIQSVALGTFRFDRLHINAFIVLFHQKMFIRQVGLKYQEVLMGWISFILQHNLRSHTLLKAQLISWKAAEQNLFASKSLSILYAMD